MSINLIPESAPFSTEQRAWLNGFFAGLLQMNAADPSGGSGGQAPAVGLLDAPAPAVEEEEDFPWHDPAISLDERLAMAKDKPPARQLMAAMAQLDCGSCGYLCQSYGEAIANGTEKTFTLCSPGGSETAKAIKQLVKLHINGDAAKNGVAANGAAEAVAAAPVGTRDNPATARFIAARKLNREGSAKDTRHVEIDLAATGLKYKVGDALGVYPFNCDELVDATIAASRFDSAAQVDCGGRAMPLREALREHKCLRTLASDLVEAAVVGGGADEMIDRLRALLDSDDLDSWDVLEFFEAFPAVRLTPQQLVDSLMPLRPRLYSIASSQHKFIDQVHRTVGRVETSLRGRGRKGVASTMFADRMISDQNLRVFIHPSHGFTIPADPAAPMIMVGPGTGIAPFMAFLQQREFDAASGRNWLFFGDQKRAHDYLYEEQLTAWQQSGLLTRLDLAFSRDAEGKVYVQQRMKENGAELFQWLEEGGYFFVCGDASRMAADVDRALHEIVAEHGRRSPADAKSYVAAMAKAKRYVRDVY